MSRRICLLDTNICSFLMRRPSSQLIQRLEDAVAAGDLLVISAITYAELRFGASAAQASPRLARMIDGLVTRLNGVLAWDASAVDETDRIRVELRRQSIVISPEDAAIAGHALSVGAVVVTNNTREFARVPGLDVEDWSTPE